MTTPASETERVLLRTHGLSVGYGKRPVLPPVDLEVRAGQLWGVVGRNGAGKTTLFRTLLGLLPVLGGSFERPGGATIGYVPQRHVVDALVPARAIDLITEGTERGLSFLSPFIGKERRARIDRAVEATGAGPFLQRRYRDLSEGEKQRVLLARALAGAPDLLVLDEPTSAMDVVAERQVIDILRGLLATQAIGILLVSHHLGLVVSIVDRILFVDADQRIATSGSPEEMLAHPVFAERYGAVLHEPPPSIPSIRPSVPPTPASRTP